MIEEKRVLQAMVHLQADSDFKVFMEWLTDRRDKARSNETVKDDILLRWLQGRAQECNDIIEAVKTSRDVLMKMK